MTTAEGQGGKITSDKEKISVERADKLLEARRDKHPREKVRDAADLAWGESYILRVLADLFEATGDRKYLDELASRGEWVISSRDDRRGIKDGSGESRPAWSMSRDFVTAEYTLTDAAGNPAIELRSTTYDYNNSTKAEVIPGEGSRFTLLVTNDRKKRTETFSDLSLDPSDERYVEKIVNDPAAPPNAKPGNVTEKSHLLRVTKVHPGRRPAAQAALLTPIPLAFVGYVGLIYEPLMRFAELTKKDTSLKDLWPVADRFIQAAEESYKDASSRLWRDGPGKDEGYYLCSEKGESFPWDNIGLPYNFIAWHVCTELALYRLTGKQGYLERSKRMVSHFKNRLRYHAENDTYSWDYWYEPVTTTGWSPADNISENMRFLKPFGGPESISYGSITVNLVAAASRMGFGFDEKEMTRFANTLLKNVLNPERTVTRANIAGKGEDPAQISSLDGFLCLSEKAPEVYKAIRETYLKWEGETLPFCAGLLRWERTMSRVR